MDLVQNNYWLKGTIVMPPNLLGKVHVNIWNNCQ